MKNSEPVLSLCRQNLARRPVDAGHQTGDPTQLLLRQPFEQRHRRELLVDPRVTVHRPPVRVGRSPTSRNQSSPPGRVAASGSDGRACGATTLARSRSATSVVAAAWGNCHKHAHVEADAGSERRGSQVQPRIAASPILLDTKYRTSRQNDALDRGSGTHISAHMRSWSLDTQIAGSVRAPRPESRVLARRYVCTRSVLREDPGVHASSRRFAAGLTLPRSRCPRLRRRVRGHRSAGGREPCENPGGSAPRGSPMPGSGASAARRHSTGSRSSSSSSSTSGVARAAAARRPRVLMRQFAVRPI